MSQEVLKLAALFEFKGEIKSLKPFGGGHINDTYLIETDLKNRYILQKINKNVFKQPLHVVNNIEKLLDHFAAKGIHSLKTYPAKDGKKYVVDVNQDFWRLYNFIENAESYEVIQNKSQAYEAGKAFGAFQSLMLDLNADDFYETIPDFHHLEKRYKKFDIVLASNPKNRIQQAEKEIKFALEQRKISDSILGFIANGQLPVRVTHNDCKLNNAMLSKQTGKGICVIDLDTVMPGLVLYDYGDMVRTFTSPVPEDEKDFSKVHLRKEIFEELTKGYLSELSAVLNAAEKENLLLGAKYMTLIMGLRFLTDFIEGDVYYKIKYDNHNLVRTKNQFALFASLESQEKELQKIIMDNI